MIATDTFDNLYHQLATAWDAHQDLRRTYSTWSELAESSFRLQKARDEMWAWHRSHVVG